MPTENPQLPDYSPFGIERKTDPEILVFDFFGEQPYDLQV
jgi:hypothetical protein